MKRKIFNTSNYKSILNFIRKFKLTDFNNMQKVKQYMTFFELKYLLKKSKKTKYPTKIKNI